MAESAVMLLATTAILADDRVRCGNCGEPNKRDAKTCFNCGADFTKIPKSTWTKQDSKYFNRLFTLGMLFIISVLIIIILSTVWVSQGVDFVLSTQFVIFIPIGLAFGFLAYWLYLLFGAFNKKETQ